MTKVTVGIPAYKTTFLVEAVSSVLTQTFTDFEVLVSDDSPDGSVTDLVGRIRDPRIRVIPGPRQGLVPNSAHIWEHARAPLLKFVYDDDKLYPTALADLLELIERDERFVFAFSHRDVIDEYGRVIRQPQTFLGETWQWFEGRAIADYAMRTMTNPVGEPTAMLIRRSAFPDAGCLHSFGGFPIRHLIDVAFFMNAAGRGRAVASPKRLCAFRQHTAQVSSNRTSPRWSLGVFEWEIFLRAAVRSGLVSPQTAQAGLEPLAAMYKGLGQGFDELGHFLAALPALGDKLAAGRTDVIDEAFLATMTEAERLMDERTARPPEPVPEAYGAAAGQRARLHLEAVTRHRASGWAWLPEDPERRLRIQALDGERVVGEARAERERPDLKEVGAGCYGFEMAFHAAVSGEAPPAFRVILEAEEFPPGDLRLEPFEGERPRPGAAAVLREHARFSAPGPEAEAFDPGLLAGAPKLVGGSDPLLIALYAARPQPPGEPSAAQEPWRRAARGLPRFPGHYQPRTPGSLGFYDPLDPSLARRQAELAKAAGVGAFGVYYDVDPAGMREHPLQRLLAARVDLPFFLIWRDERQPSGPLTPKEEDFLLADLAQHMRHPTYLRLQGRPLLVAYGLQGRPRPADSLARWRRRWADRFDLHPLIFTPQTSYWTGGLPAEIDGALEIAPHSLAARAQPMANPDAFAPDFAGRAVMYNELMRVSLFEPPPAFPMIRTALPGWDTEPLQPNGGVVAARSTPEKYQFWLRALIEQAIERPLFGRPIVAINAWNNWTQGAYLEPDVNFGAAYLNATARALRDAVANANARRAAAATTST